MGGFERFDNPERERETQFCEDLDALLNRYSRENGSNTPDFILGAFLRKCLDSWNEATKARDQWYGVQLEPGKSVDLGVDLQRALACLRLEAPEAVCKDIEAIIRRRLQTAPSPSSTPPPGGGL